MLIIDRKIEREKSSNREGKGIGAWYAEGFGYGGGGSRLVIHGIWGYDDSSRSVRERKVGAMAGRSREQSEFGGEPGRVARYTHPFGPEEADPKEYARLMRATEPTDAGDTPEGALARERRREGRA